MKIVFFGSSSYVLPILKVLRKNFDLKLVMTTESLQGDALWKSPVIKYCLTSKIPYLSVSNLSNSTINNELLTINPAVGVLADFGLIIPPQILNMFPKGIINIHPSLLPKYRGPTPVQTAILNEEKETGVSIIKLDEEIDHGPLLGQEKAEILDTDTAESLYKRLFEKGSNLLLKVLPDYLKGSIKSTAQNHSNATFTEHLTRQDGYLNISNPLTIVTEIERMIRAYFPWPGVWFKLKVNGKEKIIKLLPNNLISKYPNDLILTQVEGKKPMSYKDFLNGYSQIKQQLKELLRQLA